LEVSSVGLTLARYKVLGSGRITFYKTIMGTMYSMSGRPEQWGIVFNLDKLNKHWIDSLVECLQKDDRTHMGIDQERKEVYFWKE